MVMMMRRAVRMPGFWVVLVLIGFFINVFLAIITLHRHIQYTEEGPQEPYDASSYLLRSRKSSDHDSDSVVGSLTSALLSDGSNTESLISDTELWRRMLQEERTSNCGSHFLPILSTNSTIHPKMPQNEDDVSLMLPPLGFIKEIEHFMNSFQPSSIRGSLSTGTNPYTNLIKKSAQAIASSSSSSWTTSFPRCYLPPVTACSDTHYSVVIYSKALTLRRLVLNIMSFQAYPSVRDITLILPSADILHDLHSDDSYGSRILRWNQKGTIRLIFESSLFSSMAAVEPKESAIMWIDGDQKKAWDGTSFRTTFRLWRQNSQALVVSWMDHSDETRDVQSLDQSSCIQMSLHGTMMHRNWIAFLRHSVTAPIRQVLESDNDWEFTTRTLSILWNHLGEGHIISLGDSSIGNNTQIKKNAKLLDQRLLAIFKYFGCSCNTRGMVSTGSNSTC